MASKGKNSNKVAKKVTVKFTLNCTRPIDDEILDIASFEKFLRDRVKVNGGKPGVWGNIVQLARDGKKLVFTAQGSVLNKQVSCPLAKRYVKYLTKKFLKKNQLRDYIRVVADSKNSYDLRYFNIHNTEAEN
eukprot:GILI01013029.1.p2 GENE.GILI01013029.1~~GILI01013029.1.p2  ORF type:complete len:150 (-),score=33.56 GILI01013029.1:75-470(-)